MVIAIDGPSGAGKSTVAKKIAKLLQINYLDTGAMYRSIACFFLSKNIDVNDLENVVKWLPSIDYKVVYENGEQMNMLFGENINGKLREHHISKAASDVSKHPDVRMKLVSLQREIACENDIVADGRDMTSFVFPDAEYKFFLTASLEERARRRFEELQSKNKAFTYESVLKDIQDRDENDSTRAFAPLVQTDSAVLIDSTDLCADEVVQIIIKAVKK